MIPYEPDLLSAVLGLRPRRRVVLPAAHGAWVHGWFLRDFVRPRDPGLATVLHGESKTAQPRAEPGLYGDMPHTAGEAWVPKLFVPIAEIASDDGADTVIVGSDKPFTVSALQGGRVVDNNRLEFDASGDYWIRITAFAPAL